MKRTIRKRPAARRLSVAQAKARLSEALRSVEAGPTVIHRRGQDAAVLLGIDEYERLLAEAGAVDDPATSFLHDVAALKQRFGGGADLEAERAVLTPVDPFARRAR